MKKQAWIKRCETIARKQPWSDALKSSAVLVEPAPDAPRRLPRAGTAARAAVAYERWCAVHAAHAEFLRALESAKVAARGVERVGWSPLLVDNVVEEQQKRIGEVVEQIGVVVAGKLDAK